MAGVYGTGLHLLHCPIQCSKSQRLILRAGFSGIRCIFNPEVSCSCSSQSALYFLKKPNHTKDIAIVVVLWITSHNISFKISPCWPLLGVCSWLHNPWTPLFALPTPQVSAQHAHPGLGIPSPFFLSCFNLSYLSFFLLQRNLGVF